MVYLAEVLLMLATGELGQAPLLTTGDPTSPTPSSSASAGDEYHYNWKTSKSWSGCRELIVKVVDGSYHRAVSDFGAS